MSSMNNLNEADTTIKSNRSMYRSANSTSNLYRVGHDEDHSSTGVAALRVVLAEEQNDEVHRLKEEISFLKYKLAFIEKTGAKKNDYYFNLLWFIQMPPKPKDESFYLNKIKDELGDDTFLEWRLELQRLRSCSSNNNNSSWHHGFSAGCLAINRLHQRLARISMPAKREENGVFSVETQQRKIVEEFPFVGSSYES